MTWRWALAATLLLLAGCGGGATTGGAPATSTTTTTTPPPASTTAASAPPTTAGPTTTRPPVSTATTSTTTSTTVPSGAEIFASRCAACHGQAAEGYLGPTLAYPRVPGAYPSPSEELAVVRDGRGTMPAFGGVLDAAELQAVVDWIRSRA